MNKPNDIALIEDLLLNKGLYTILSLELIDIKELRAFLVNNENEVKQIKCFCSGCENDSIFKVTSTISNKEFTSLELIIKCTDEGQEDREKKGNIFCELTFECIRNKRHLLMFFLVIDNKQIIKFGQYPSLMDLNIKKNKQYKQVLNKYYKEYTKAIGLYSHGVGIGAFVYLRRILESLIFDTYKSNFDLSSLSDDVFKSKGFREQIDLLSDYLPPLLIKYKEIYGVISKGIHELCEQECLNLFPRVKMGIELILDEFLHKKEEIAKIKDFDNFLHNKKPSNKT